MMLDEYFLPTYDIQADKLLSDWRWLIGDKPISVLAIGAIGNLFLQGQSGRVFLLEIEDGTCECIADSVDEFQAKLGDRHNRRAWLRTFLIRELRNRGMELGPGQCYGSKIPSVLGGGPGCENVEAVDVLVHVSILGQIHKQARGMPPGSVIDEIRVDAPDN
jgi:hypothetical protein